MKRLIIAARLCVAVAITLYSLTSSAIAGSSANDDNISSLPTSKRWMEHVCSDIMPFWMTEEAYGSPVGSFPTFRYNDGMVVNTEVALRDEYARLMDDPNNWWITDRLDRQYIRMISRQTYLYGVAYHLTGDERMLELARAGTMHLLNNCQEDSGLFVSWIENGKVAPTPNHRTSQDMAYALLGPSFYYYLTRDEDVLEKIIKAKNAIFEQYAEGDSWGYFKWVESNYDDGKEHHDMKQRELVAILDQINAYMLLITPILPDSERQVWEADLEYMSGKIIADFYEPGLNVFWGRIDEEEDKKLGGKHVDFGHSIKSLWMLYLIGLNTSNEKLIAFSDEHAKKLLQEAYLDDIGAWGEKKLQGNMIERSRVWWIYAELDQMAATLSLDDESMSSYLVKTYDYWFDIMVDSRHGSVWHSVSDDYGISGFPKVHLWKNGYHSLEHALVGYITCQELKNQPVELFYAFNVLPEADKIRPYYFRGDIKRINISELSRIKDHLKYRIKFSNVR